MRSIVYNDISKSNFKYDLYDELTFYFSSEFNKTRFIDGCDRYVEEETKKLESKYHVKFQLITELSIAFYKKIEKRGYRVEDYITGLPYNL